MSWQRSRGIHAARPTPHRLRSACTQVAICGVWAGVQKDQKPKRAPFVAVRLAGGSDFTDATAGKPGCYTGSRQN